MSAKIGDDGKLHLVATVIECKLQFANSTEHITKAIMQVEQEPFCSWRTIQTYANN